jgi:outer membrane protein
MTRAAILIVVLLPVHRVVAQTAPPSYDRPWHSTSEQEFQSDGKGLRTQTFSIDSSKTYSLAELIDLAEAHNPETSLAWERARAQAAALGIARSELYPTLAAVALSQTSSFEVLFGNTFLRQTVQSLQATFDLTYTVFDFGARSGRVGAARADVLAADFGFNDVHRNVIYQVEQAYYRLLNAAGQEDAARASLSNAQTVQQAAEERLKQGLATLPDVLEARSATASADYQLQAVLGDEEIARGNLATALGTSPTAAIHVQPLAELPIPDSLDETVEQAIDRAFRQRPDLLQQVAQVRSANARVKEARAAFYPALTVDATPNAELLYGSQQFFPWVHTASGFGALSVNLNWTVFDGGARKNRLRQAQAGVRAAEAQAKVTGDQVENEVWAAYSDLNTAFRQRKAAVALLNAADQSYAAALESYKYGVRSLLDVTAAQQTLAQARSTDVLARTQVLGTFAEMAFRTGDLIQAGARKP